MTAGRKDRSQFQESLTEAAAEARAWDAVGEELGDWPDERLEGARKQLQALVERLERLRADVDRVCPTDTSLSSQAAIALRYAHAGHAWVRHLLHERLPPADLDAQGE